jgi:hypothetical protein
MSAPVDRPEKPKPAELPEWVRRALEATVKTVQKIGRQLPDRNQPLWPLMLDAAVVAGFLPRELAPETLEGAQRANAEKAVLSFAEPLRDVSGVRWTLTADSRKAVLNEAIGTDELSASLKRTATQFSDPLSNALRTWLSRRETEPTFDNLEALEASRIVISWLSQVPGLKLPPLDDVDREIELRRLLAPFERMIGQKSTGTEAAKNHRFFGRERELDKLRAYVGVVPSGSLAGTASRAVNWLARSLVGRAPLAVWGVGGAGKTTLISKFMLEHAQAAASRYPFAYLDFDRTTISGGNRVGLLAEMCSQVAAQFPALTRPMLNLRSQVVQFARGTADAAQLDSISRLTPYLGEFRGLIDEHMRALESSLESARPFLLVFDTFEVVQYTPDDVASLEEFVGAFSAAGDSGLWPRMRLIVSGRKRITEFLGQKVEKLPVGALDPKGCVEMLLALAADAKKSISAVEAADLVTALAKATEESKGGVQPLRIRLSGEILAKSPDDGSTTVRTLLKEFAEPLTPGGLAAQVLIDGVLVRRIVGHITDPRVRALADPGLVVRRITVDVIREVMTRATNKPKDGLEDPKDLDADVREPWIVDQAEAEAIFEAFKHEVSLVQIDGDSLRHRPDVRQEMLPLIRARRPRRFQDLHRTAFRHFSALAEADPKDYRSAAEAVYQGLGIGAPLTHLDRLWPRAPRFDPRIDAEEFPEDSLQNTFVRAKTGNPLTSQEFSSLPKEITLDWAGARSLMLLNRQRLDEADLAGLREVTGELFEALDDRANDAGTLARLLYRYGLWDEAVQLAERQLRRRSFDEKSLSEGEMSLIRVALTVAAKSGGEGSSTLERLVEVGNWVRDPLVRVELSAHSFIYRFRTRRDLPPSVRELADRSIADVSKKRWLREPRILRLAILVGGDNVRDLIALYLDTMDRLPCDPQVLFPEQKPAWLNYVANAPQLETIGVSFREGNTRETLEGLEAFWRSAKPQLIKSLDQQDFPIADMQRLIAFDHMDWIRCLGNALTRAGRSNEGRYLMSQLADSRFVEPKKSVRLSGLEIVRSAADGGRLLDFARNVREWGYNRPSAESLSLYQPSSYPNDIYKLGESLTRWHEALLEILSPPEPQKAYLS